MDCKSTKHSYSTKAQQKSRVANLDLARDDNIGSNIEEKKADGKSTQKKKSKEEKKNSGSLNRTKDW